MASGPGSAALHRPARLSDRVRDVLRRRHYSLRTEQTYLAWMTRFVAYHGRHPDEMDAPEVIAFLTHLAVDLVSPSTQRQAQSALVFLCRTAMGGSSKGSRWQSAPEASANRS